MSLELVLASTLTLTHAVGLAVERSPEVQAAVQRAAEAGLEEPLLVSNTDPAFEGGYTAADDQSPRAAPAFEGTRARSESWHAGFTQKTLLGTEARVAFRNDRLLNRTPFRVLDPTVDSSLAVELSQPLMRYFWGRPDTARRKRARARTAAARALLRVARERAAFATARSFLELLFARKSLEIREAALADARTLLKKYQEKRGYGLIELSDLLQARASVEVQELELATAEIEAARAQNALQAALNRVETPLPALEMPSLRAPAGEPNLSLRPDLELARSDREHLEWAARIETLDTLPEVNLNLSYGVHGLATTYRQSWREMSTFDRGVRSAGVFMRVPLIFRKERLTRKAARLRLEAAKAEEERARTAAWREWRDAAEVLRLARRRADAQRRLVELERDKYAAEDANFKRGRSTTDLLLRFQQDVRRAETLLLRAEVDEAAAKLELARSGGTLLEELGL